MFGWSTKFPVRRLLGSSSSTASGHDGSATSGTTRTQWDTNVHPLPSCSSCSESETSDLPSSSFVLWTLFTENTALEACVSVPGSNTFSTYSILPVLQLAPGRFLHSHGSLDPSRTLQDLFFFTWIQAPRGSWFGLWTLKVPGLDFGLLKKWDAPLTPWVQALTFPLVKQKEKVWIKKPCHIFFKMSSLV